MRLSTPAFARWSGPLLRAPAGSCWLAWLLAGCGQLSVEGEVRTGSGAPAVGARVQAEGEDCATTVDAQGRFELSCRPGPRAVHIAQDGYLPVRVELPATDGAARVLEPQTLVQIPPGPGLYWSDAGVQRPLPRAWLERRVQGASGKGRSRAWCLLPDAAPATVLPPGVTSLYDMEATPWRPFRLDAEGCAYRDQQNDQGQWEVGYKDKPPTQERELQPGLKLVLVELPAGDYFLADWGQGFFTPDPAQAERYTGYWLSVR